MNIRKIVTLLALSALLAGCVTPELTSLQRRSIEARELEGKFDDAQKATIQVFQDYGYIIKSSDYQSGVIQAESGVKQNLFGLMTNNEITATIEQFGPDRVKERITLVNKRKVSSQYGTQENSSVIDDPQLFQRMYDDIQKEMFVRRNLAK
ncbi:MAG: hypothetical protein WC417_07050 [Candidatus Omnitrophota bacterium]|jgi:hypothetical protein